jgi:predicted metal-binding membrane protein
MSGGMAMPGGWTMSMAWMRMPGQTWLGAAAAFMAMWIVMMVAMMLPSLASMLAGYRRSLRGLPTTRLGSLTAIAGAAYFLVWAAVGAAAYAVGVALGAAEMRWEALARAVPSAIGVVVLLAGCLQLTAWKARQLGHCRAAPVCGGSPPPDAGSAWRHGLRLGVRCGLCCSGLMVILLVAGVMDLRAMAMVAAAITLERLAPRPQLAARATGVAVIMAGALVVLRALRHS